MTAGGVRWTGLTALLAVLLAVAAYFVALDSAHAPTGGDEVLYSQITLDTARSGHWLPLQTRIERLRNTKPPGLFWQGLVSTDWTRRWSLWRLRLPNVLYTLATAGMVFLLGRRLAGDGSTGLLAALVYLSFFGVFRYGRTFLTSGPETFWLFVPFFLLLFRRPRARGLTWSLAVAFGLAVGVALLYKSFALVVPVAAGVGWWTLRERGYRVREWLGRDLSRIAVLGVVALGVFGLWFALDPRRDLLLRDFVIRENVAKFDPAGGTYLGNLIWGPSSVWRNVVSYPVNAGLLAPAVVALLLLSWRHRRERTEPEELLWIWVATLFVVFTLPDQRDERYLLPGMPAIAVLVALRWERIPRWVLGASLGAVAALAIGLGAGAVVLAEAAGTDPLHPWFFWAAAAGTAAFALAGIGRKEWTRAFVCPAVLMLYLCFAAFLIPFDGPRGRFDQAARDLARGRPVAVPVNWNAREEVYRLALPGSDPRPYDVSERAPLERLRRGHGLFVVSVPPADTSVERSPGLRIVGSRLWLNDWLDAAETVELWRGHVAGTLLKKDVLVEVVERPPSPPPS